MTNRPQKPIRNIADAELMDFMSPKGKFKAKLCRMGPSIGAEKLGACLTVLEPGRKSFPFHVHHFNEEMMYVIEGEGEYRFGPETYKVRAGDLIAAPAGGPERAHQMTNTGAWPLRYLCFSTMHPVDVVEYPDSGKILAYSANPENPMAPRVRHIARPGTSLDYFEGEDE
ncbi:MAG TPA: cupin domain-containing protein [Parvularculaceae bacterium]|nr:cupin domain-containing protein [Parvularculaceae bacterium]